MISRRNSWPTRLNVIKEIISKWEDGTLLPTLIKAIELSQLFDCSIDALVRGSNHAPINRDKCNVLYTYDEPAQYLLR